MNMKLPCLLARHTAVLAVKEVCSITEIISTAALFTKCHRHHRDIWIFKKLDWPLQLWWKTYLLWYHMILHSCIWCRFSANMRQYYWIKEGTVCVEFSSAIEAIYCRYKPSHASMTFRLFDLVPCAGLHQSLRLKRRWRCLNLNSVPTFFMHREAHLFYITLTWSIFKSSVTALLWMLYFQYFPIILLIITLYL